MIPSIGIFDSGLGGLTVLKDLASQFPHESFCYLGDIARLPYGNKSPETIRRYGLQIMEFLKNQDVKAIIIACNSASSVFLGEDEYQGIPLLNVIEPGAAAAVLKGEKNIGVIGTSATIRSGAYSSTLKSLASDVTVTEMACPLFVPLVEEGIVGEKLTQLAVERYLRPLKDKNIKTLILGCTHYPILKSDIALFMGQECSLIESGPVLATQLKALMQDGQIPVATGTRQLRVCITDLTDHFERLAGEFMYPETIGSLEKIVL